MVSLCGQTTCSVEETGVVVEWETAYISYITKRDTVNCKYKSKDTSVVMVCN